MTDRLRIFAANRPRLYGIAYRMLASRAESEDMVQNTYLRWHSLSDEQFSAILNPQAWLVTVISRLCIDRLRALQLEREHYPGPWLPEPLIDVDQRTPELLAELSSDVSMAFLSVLERLNADERAAFLLHQVFDVDYAALADMLKKSPAACRQLVHRARAHVQQDKPRFQVNREHHRQLLQQFTLAAQSGDVQQLCALFTDDASLTGDGGGKVASVNRVLYGALRIARLHHVIARQFGERMQYVMAEINGEPGLLRYIDGKLDSSISIVTDGEKILAMYAVRNPDKLT